ncbi:uncharacterized protein LOC6558775 [Drosophila grimshawi]|uniref:GH17160 n=1 Tax=Drosophila grimshawi TaxID=7222 RepID=B4J173_DROGR|nr:uncharacterized protein LOC6558775 [Drosophila grimshawi]EDV97942.1 GH17160 [Drosophila grimshawi]
MNHFLAVLLCSPLCTSQQLAQNQNQPKPNDGEEALRLEALLKYSRKITTQKPDSTSTATSKTGLANDDPLEDQDYNFLTDRLPHLTDDEFNSLSHDANPLHFLKQLADENKANADPDKTLTEPESTQAQENNSESVAGAPIYITIPIYINTSGTLPLSLTIGEQDLQLQQVKNSSTQKNQQSTEPLNTYFNRLLAQIDPPRRRITNRHRSQGRSQSRSKIQLLRDYNNAQLNE